MRALDPTDPEVLYATGGGLPGLLKSVDGGSTWTSIATGSSSVLTIDPRDRRRLFWGISWSVDGGHTWRPLSQGFPPLGLYEVALDPTGTALFAGTTGGVYSLDLGEFSYVLPAAVSIHGRNGSFFHSHVRVFNTSAAETALVTATYRCSSPGCGAAVQTFAVSPRRETVFEDMAVELFGAPDSAGSVELESTQRLVVDNRSQDPICVPGAAD